MVRRSVYQYGGTGFKFDRWGLFLLAQNNKRHQGPPFLSEMGIREILDGREGGGGVILIPFTLSRAESLGNTDLTLYH